MPLGSGLGLKKVAGNQETLVGFVLAVSTRSLAAIGGKFGKGERALRPQDDRSRRRFVGSLTKGVFHLVIPKAFAPPRGPLSILSVIS